MTRVLVIEPDPDQRDALASALGDSGFQVAETDRMTAAPAGIDVLVAGNAILRDAGEFRALTHQLPVVVIASPGDVREAVTAIKLGAADYLPAPFDSAEVVAAVERSMIDHAPTARAGVDGDELLGNSTAMRDLRSQIAKAACTGTTVLIQGESGTGKELVARALHAKSPRNHAPLISINCAAVPESMIEVELFGQQRLPGQPAHRGLLQAAQGGTLFLDEVGELPLEAQARLLQVVTEGAIRPVGATVTETVDVRIIAATHHNLHQLMESGRFREDLYYRLNVVTLYLPALAEHKEDIPVLTERFLVRTARRLDRTPLKLSADAMATLRDYPWPGNVRELENAIERAAILCDSDQIGPELLAIDPRRRPTTEAGVATELESDQTSLEDYFVNFVLEHQDQLTETELAQKLGISRKSLWERRQRLNIPRRKTRKRGPRTGT